MKKFLTMFLVVLSFVLLTGCGTQYTITIQDDQKTIEMLENEEVKVNVEYTEGTTLIWTTSDEAVVTVSNGTLKGVKAGSATITVTMKDHEKVSCQIAVTVNKIPVESAAIEGADEVFIGNTEEYRFVVKPETAEIVETNWSVDKADVAKLEGTKLTGLKAGKATLRVDYKAADGKEGFAEKEVEVKAIDVSGISLQFESKMLIGESQTIEVRVHPNDATVKEVTFKSSDDKIATVDEKGVVKAIAAGIVDITVTSKSNADKKNIATISVEKPVAKQVIINHTKDELLIGETDNISATITPELASQEVEWSVDPADCATIKDGVITAVKPGLALVKATATDGSGMFAQYKLKISKPASTKVTIGTTEYENLAKALAAAQEGDVLEIDGQVFTEPITINVSGITLTVNKKEETPVQIDSMITIAKDVKNVKFEELEFLSGGGIETAKEGGQDGIFVNNCKFVGSVQDPSIGVITFYGPTKNFKFTNNKVIACNSGRFFRVKVSIENMEISHNHIDRKAKGGVYDWMYVDGYTQGNITITNNYFGSTLQTGLNIQHHSNGNYLIADNTFQDITAAAIDIRSYQAIEGVTPKSEFTIRHNLMDNSNSAISDNWGCIRLRFKGYEVANLKVNINYNTIINWDNECIVDDAGSADIKFKTPICNMNNNYIDGVASDKIDAAKMFGGIALSWENMYTDTKQLEIDYALSNIDNDPHALLVGKAEGYTKTPYATLAKALEAAKEGDIIYLMPGEHTGDVTISKNNIVITSLNRFYNPNTAGLPRKAEATYNGKITLGKELKNVEISGIKFIGEASIVNTLGVAGAAHDEKTNIDGFLFKNNIVESALTTGDAFLYTNEAASCYSKDIHIINNYFKTLDAFAVKAVVMLDNNFDVNVIGNTFDTANCATALHFYDTTKGLSGNNTKINSNTFKDVAGDAIKVNWLSVLPIGYANGRVEINDNKFSNVTGTAIDLGRMNNGDAYEAIQVNFNQFTKVGTGVSFARVHLGANITFNYNVYNDVPTKAYIKYGSAECGNPSKLNAKDNMYLEAGKVITPDAAKFITDKEDMIDYATTIKGDADLPKYNTNATSIEIECPELFVGDKVKATIKYNGDKVTNFGVKWSTSDETVATVDEFGNIQCLQDGTVTITATYLFDESIKATKEFTIISYTEIKFDFDNDGYLKVNESFEIKATIEGVETDGKIVWSSSDPTIAKVENGKVTGLKEGTATITAKIDGKDIVSTYTIEVKDLSKMDELLKLLVENNNGVVWNQTINYHGYEAGCESVPHNVYGSVNNYFAGKAPKVTENPIGENVKNMPGEGDQKYMKSLEFITIHDTGAAGAGSTALANSRWCTNPSNDGTSWHYTIGNDGIYHQVEDTKITWHAGDGTSWGTTTELRNTGIKADPDLRNRGKVTIKDGFFYVNGQKTSIAIPAGADKNARVNDTGFVCVVKDGYYHLPTAYVLKSGVVSARGGGLNSIGIETAVNTGSDVYLTWQYVAKHVATLLVKHKLGPDRVVFHNSWSNKMCPQTMMRANKTETFLDMVYAEYYVLKNFSDYKIEFISHNPDIIDNTGRVVGQGPYTSVEVSYTIKVTNKAGVSQEALCHSFVQGSHIH